MVVHLIAAEVDVIGKFDHGFIFKDKTGITVCASSIGIIMVGSDKSYVKKNRDRKVLVNEII